MNHGSIAASSSVPVPRVVRKLLHLRHRRAIVRDRSLDQLAGEVLEESCLPSYTHPNIFAAFTEWWRLFAAVELFEALRGTGQGPILVFGSWTGELRHLTAEVPS